MIAWIIGLMGRRSGGVGGWMIIAAVVVIAGLAIALAVSRAQVSSARADRKEAVAELDKARVAYRADLTLKQTTINTLNATSAQQDLALDGLRDQVRQTQAASARLAADRQAAARIMAKAQPVCSDNSTLVVDRETSARALQFLLGR